MVYTKTLRIHVVFIMYCYWQLWLLWQGQCWIISYLRRELATSTDGGKPCFHMPLLHSYTITEEYYHRHLHRPSMDEGAHGQLPQYCRHGWLVTATEGHWGESCLIKCTCRVYIILHKREMKYSPLPIPCQSSRRFLVPQRCKLVSCSDPSRFFRKWSGHETRCKRRSCGRKLSTRLPDSTVYTHTHTVSYKLIYLSQSTAPLYMFM